MIQLILHLVGDYVTQSHWMATSKTRSSFAALCHATIYAIPFFLIGGWRAVFVIWSTHFFVDRFRLARYVVFAKNQMGPGRLRWRDCSATGYPNDVPAWLSVWLLIACDNTLHLAINYAALRWVR